MKNTRVFIINICVFISIAFGEISHHASQLEDGSCLNGNCENSDIGTTFKNSKDEYLLDKVHEVFRERINEPREPTEEEVKAILHEIRQGHVIDDVNTDEKLGDDAIDTIEDVVENVEEQSHNPVASTGVSTDGDYEFPKLVRVDPGQVGDEVELELQDGKFYKRITKSVKPPVFVIPDFLSAEECDHIIETAERNGLNISNLFGKEIKDELAEERNNSDISRISEQTWLYKSNLGADFWTNLNTRLARLTELDIGILERAEPMQVVSYMPGGHYHAHLDSVKTNNLPCCFQTRCGEKEETSSWAECCRLCRFITVLYYLNDVEEGGETAFPLADMPDDPFNEKMKNSAEEKWFNLSLYCRNSTLIVSPKRGTAVFWYTHFIDEETGYLGPVDDRSHHGGCDLIKGNKWIANNWISSPTYENRFKQGVFYTP